MPSDPFWLYLCLLSFAINILLVLSYAWRKKILQFFGKAGPVRTKDKMSQIMDEGERKGCIKSSERKLVENIFEFKERTAADVMIHRRDVVMISKEETHEEIMHLILKTGLSRFPVYDSNADDVLGILAVRKYLLNSMSVSKRNIEEIIYPAYFVPTTVGAEQLLRDMQSRKTHIAIVVDEYGGVDGIVTLEDLLEEIVGNIYDEFDPLAQQQIIQISENLWRVAGGTELEEVAQTVGITLPELDLDFDTVGGLIFDQLDIIPEDGVIPKIEAFGMGIQVEKMMDRRIQWVTLSLLPEASTQS